MSIYNIVLQNNTRKGHQTNNSDHNLDQARATECLVVIINNNNKIPKKLKSRNFVQRQLEETFCLKPVKGRQIIVQKHLPSQSLPLTVSYMCHLQSSSVIFPNAAFIPP